MKMRCLTGIFVIIAFTTFAQSEEKPLSYFLNEGLSNSPVLKDLNNQAHSNSIDSLLVKAGYKPQVTFNTWMMYAPVINGYGYSDVITNGQNLSSTFNATQTIFNKKTINAQYSGFGIQNQSLLNLSKLTSNDLKKVITAQYLTAYSVLTDKQSTAELLTTTLGEDAILKELVNQGFYKQTDYLTFLIELQSLTLQIAGMEIQYKRELSALNNLCGIKDTTTYILLLPELAGNPLGQSPVSLLFMRYKIDSLRIQNQKYLIDRHYKPELKWFTDAGIVNNEPRYIYQNFGISLGLSLSLPVFDGNQRKLNYQKLKSSEDTRKNYEDSFRRQYDQQIRQLNGELRSTQQLIPQMMKQLDLFNELIHQDWMLVNQGTISITEYITALKNYIVSQKDLNQMKIKKLEIINEINYLIQN